MEPLNRKERNGFIVKFSAAFLAGILIILIPFYFILRMPVYENTLMTKDFKDMQIQMKYQKDVFAVQIDSIGSMMERYNVAGQDIDKLNADLGTLLSETEKPFVYDTSWSGRMYKTIVNSYIELKKTKNDKLNSDKDLKDSQEELEKTKEAAKEAEKAALPVSSDTKGRNKKKK